LDPSARKAVWEKLSSFKDEYNATIFFNTHYMDEADQYADMIAIINGGRIVKMGTAEELKSSVGGDVITITVDKTPDSRVLEKLGSLKSVSSVLPDGTEIKIVAKDAETALPKIIDTLRDGQTVMSRIEMKKPTLDDVFLKYAGTKLEAAGNVSEVRQMRRMIQHG
jgi:ABC-2 type transport system ATP-binding protein